jgi:hypothetical protein
VPQVVHGAPLLLTSVADVNPNMAVLVGSAAKSVFPAGSWSVANMEHCASDKAQREAKDARVVGSRMVK